MPELSPPAASAKPGAQNLARDADAASPTTCLTRIDEACAGPSPASSLGILPIGRALGARG